MRTPSFSVALATYNGERYLREQLDSIAAQSLLPQELVICDDGSTDGTLSVTEAFARDAPFEVRVLRNEGNLGFGSTFLRAFDGTTAEYVAFCDQDDVWLPQKLSRYAEALRARPTPDLLTHAAQQVDERLRPLPYRFPDYRRAAFLGPLQNPPLGVYFGFTCCVRASLLGSMPRAGRPEDRFSPGRPQPHDQLAYHAANAFGKVAVLPETLALYRRHGVSLTGGEGGVYDVGIRAQATLRLGGDGDEYRWLSTVAAQQASYFERMLELGHRVEAEDVEARTRQAARYFAMLADALSRRAAIYDRGAGPLRRARALARAFATGGYTGSHGGRGLGMGPLLKDAAQTILPW